MRLFDYSENRGRPQATSLLPSTTLKTAVAFTRHRTLLQRNKFSGRQCATSLTLLLLARHSKRDALNTQLYVTRPQLRGSLFSKHLQRSPVGDISDSDSNKLFCHFSGKHQVTRLFAHEHLAKRRSAHHVTFPFTDRQHQEPPSTTTHTRKEKNKRCLHV